MSAPVRADSIAECLQLTVDGSIGQDWPEGLGIKENVDVFPKTAGSGFQPFGQARAALEDDFIVGAGHDPQGLGDVVVLLDNGGTQSRRAKDARRPQDRLPKSRCSNSFTQRPSFACQSRACGSLTADQNRNAKTDSGKRRSARSAAGFLPISHLSRRAARARAAAPSPAILSRRLETAPFPK